MKTLMNFNLVNLTPHAVRIGVSGESFNETYCLEASGDIARVSTSSTQIGTILGAGLYVESPGEVTGLPETKEGTFLVVSRVVAEACPERQDLLVPHGLIRDGQGAVIGCQGLARIEPRAQKTALVAELADRIHQVFEGMGNYANEDSGFWTVQKALDDIKEVVSLYEGMPDLAEEAVWRDGFISGVANARDAMDSACDKAEAEDEVAEAYGCYAGERHLANQRAAYRSGQEEA